MCGINGLIDFQKRHTKEERHEIVHKMNEAIVHRGPDHEGTYDNEWMSMGMRRLSILDLKTGNQPVYNTDQSIVTVFNGEIYNYKDLKKQLNGRNYLFKTTCDTEVIVHLFEEFGAGCFSMLDGMFAIALLDIRKEKFYLARDRMGEKPLYYTAENGGFLFSSELISLLKTGYVNKKINVSALNFYFQYTYIPAPYTIFENVYKLEAGHYLVIDRNGSVVDKRYWELRENPEIGKLSYEEASKELEKLLSSSVKERMNCDVPYGAFLSGGVDSGIIASLMAKHSKDAINTFTIGFQEKEYDESKNAAVMARHIGSRHHECILSYRDALGIMEEVIRNMDEPFADSSAIPEYLVARHAAGSVKVVLTGDGGDELFLGYDKYLINSYADRYLFLPSFIRKGFVEPAFRIFPDRSVLSRKANKVIRNAYYDAFERRNRTMQLGFKSEEMKELLCGDYYGASCQELVKKRYEDATGSDLHKAQYTDLKVVLEGDMLVKVDRMSMLNSLEARTPLLANSVVEFAYSLPDEYKIWGKAKKRILKERFQSTFPKGFDKLPKSGFGVPLDHWFRNEMKKQILETLESEKLKRQGIFNASYVERVLREHFSGKVNRKSEIWTLYVFERWHENHM